jgi:hypothetical protein
VGTYNTKEETAQKTNCIEGIGKKRADGPIRSWEKACTYTTNEKREPKCSVEEERTKKATKDRVA